MHSWRRPMTSCSRGPKPPCITKAVAGWRACMLFSNDDALVQSDRWELLQCSPSFCNMTILSLAQVCSLIGGCNGIINTGDNFYGDPAILIYPT